MNVQKEQDASNLLHVLLWNLLTSVVICTDLLPSDGVMALGMWCLNSRDVIVKLLFGRSVQPVRPLVFPKTPYCSFLPRQGLMAASLLCCTAEKVFLSAGSTAWSPFRRRIPQWRWAVVARTFVPVTPAGEICCASISGTRTSASPPGTAPPTRATTGAAVSQVCTPASPVAARSHTQAGPVRRWWPVLVSSVLRGGCVRLEVLEGTSVLWVRAPRRSPCPCGPCLPSWAAVPPSWPSWSWAWFCVTSAGGRRPKIPKRRRNRRRRRKREVRTLLLMIQTTSPPTGRTWPWGNSPKGTRSLISLKGRTPTSSTMRPIFPTTQKPSPVPLWLHRSKR